MRLAFVKKTMWSPLFSYCVIRWRRRAREGAERYNARLLLNVGWVQKEPLLRYAMLRFRFEKDETGIGEGPNRVRSGDLMRQTMQTRLFPDLAMLGCDGTRSSTTQRSGVDDRRTATRNNFHQQPRDLAQIPSEQPTRTHAQKHFQCIRRRVSMVLASVGKKGNKDQAREENNKTHKDEIRSSVESGQQASRFKSLRKDFSGSPSQRVRWPPRDEVKNDGARSENMMLDAW